MSLSILSASIFFPQLFIFFILLIEFTRPLTNKVTVTVERHPFYSNVTKLHSSVLFLTERQFVLLKWVFLKHAGRRDEREVGNLGLYGV